MTSDVTLSAISAYEGDVKSRVRWMPALRTMQDRVGWALVILCETPSRQPVGRHGRLGTLVYADCVRYASFDLLISSTTLSDGTCALGPCAPPG